MLIHVKYIRSDNKSHKLPFTKNEEAPISNETSSINISISALHQIAANPAFRSSRISSIFSRPTESLIRPPLIPAATSCSSVS